MEEKNAKELINELAAKLLYQKNLFESQLKTLINNQLIGINPKTAKDQKKTKGET